MIEFIFGFAVGLVVYFVYNRLTKKKEAKPITLKEVEELINTYRMYE